MRNLSNKKISAFLVGGATLLSSAAWMGWQLGGAKSDEEKAVAAQLDPQPVPEFIYHWDRASNSTFLAVIHSNIEKQTKIRYVIVSFFFNQRDDTGFSIILNATNKGVEKRLGYRRFFIDPNSLEGRVGHCPLEQELFAHYLADKQSMQKFMLEVLQSNKMPFTPLPAAIESLKKAFAAENGLREKVELFFQTNRLQLEK